MEGQDLTKGPLKKLLWSLAWPLMLSVFFHTLYNIVDTFWVSKLSPEAIAAVSISQITLFIMISLSMGINAGSGVIMAMHIGAKDKKGAERVLGQSFVLAAIAAGIFTLISLLFRSQLLIATGAGGEVFQPALEYFTITAAGSILMFLMMTAIFVYNAQGDTFTLTKLFALSTLINVILDPLLIFGYFGFPALGISGAAYATLISQLIFLIIAVRSLSSSHRRIRFHFSNLRMQWESVKKVLNIGVPASLTQVINPIGTAALMFVIALGFEEVGTISYSLGFRVEFFAFLPAIGFGFGSMALIGQNIGAGEKVRARKSFDIALRYGFLAATGIGILAALFADSLIRIFTTDPQVIESTQLYLWSVALSYGFMAATMVEASAFQAIGRSWPGFWITFIRFAVVTIPLSYVLTQVYNASILGVWAGVIAGNVIAGVIGYIWIEKTMRKITMSTVPVHK